MNTNQGKAAPPTNALSAKALEYYRMYSGNEDLPKYFCGAYQLTQASTSTKPANIPEIIIEDCEGPPTSPTSSITSAKKLEWDSGADIGYANYNPRKSPTLQKSSSMPVLQTKKKSENKDNSKEQTDNESEDEQCLRRKELMMFLRLKVGNPNAESTPVDRADKPHSSDPEIYISQTPRKGNLHIVQKQLNTTIFNFEVPPSDGENVNRAGSEEHPKISKIFASGSNSTGKSTTSMDTLPDKTVYFDCYRQKKIKNLQISAPMNLECVSKKTDRDAGTQTTIIQPRIISPPILKTNASIAVQTSRRSSKQEVLYLFHPGLQCDKTTSSSSSNGLVDKVFSNCNSFEYLAGESHEAKKSTSSTLESQSSKGMAIGCTSSSTDGAKGENLEETLKLMQKLVSSKKYDNEVKELYIRKMAKQVVKSSSTSESDKIIPKPKITGRLEFAQDGQTSSTNTSTKQITSDKSGSRSKDWKNLENETQSEKLYSSVEQESTDSPKEALVSFAKRERESQLNWINSEIEHLAKLKSLLEIKKQPKNLGLPKKQLKITTQVVPNLNYKKSTAVYMITTEKKGAKGDCAEDCTSTAQTNMAGEIDFHVHNNLGVRDYHFKEIITKITPDPQAQLETHAQNEQSTDIPNTHKSNNPPPIYVSEHQNSCRPKCACKCACNNPCCPCRCCPHYPDPRQPTYCQAPKHFQRDIYPIPTAAADNVQARSRSSSPRSTSITDDTSGYPSRRKHQHRECPGKEPRPQTAPSNNEKKKLEKACKIKKRAHREMPTTEGEGDDSRSRPKTATVPEANKGNKSDEEDESEISRYESLSKYQTTLSTTKGLKTNPTPPISQNKNAGAKVPTPGQSPTPSSSSRGARAKAVANAPLQQETDKDKSKARKVPSKHRDQQPASGKITPSESTRPESPETGKGCLRTSNPYCNKLATCEERCPAMRKPQKPSENQNIPKTPTKPAPTQVNQGVSPKRSEDIRSYKEYKALKQAHKTEKEKEREKQKDNEAGRNGETEQNVERCTNTEGVWESSTDSDDDNYTNCPSPVYNAGKCECQKAGRNRCSCKEQPSKSVNPTVSLQTVDTTPEFSEKGIRTDEPTMNTNGKEIQVNEQRPEMKQMAVGDDARRSFERASKQALSLTPAAVVTYTPSSAENLPSMRTATNNNKNGGKKSYKMVKDMSKINLRSAVVISSVVTTSVANPEDNIRRLVLEMPLDEQEEDGKPKKNSKDGDEDSTVYTSAMDSCSCTSSDAQSTSAGSTSEVMCSCCGKCIATSESSLVLNKGGDNMQPSGPFCWPCYHQSTKREWNPQDPYYQQADHMCNCYNNVDNRALDKIRETLRQLAEIDNAQAPASNSKGAKPDRLVCQSCNKKIKREQNKKPVAYVLKFEPGDEVDEDEQRRHMQSLQEIRVKVPMAKHKKKRKSSDVDTNTTEGKGTRKGKHSDKEKEQRDNKNLQDYLATNRPDFVKSAEERRRCLIELAYMREQRCQKYKQLLALSNGIPSQNPGYSDKKHPRLFTTKQMKQMTAKNYKKLPEVQQKLLDNRDKQIKKANRLLADIFNQKLRENVLRGQASLSTSISVINLM